MDVCIIGAGPSGLCAAKEIQEGNPDSRVLVYEQSPSLGGTFARSYKGLMLVNNPLLISFSDFLAEERINNLRMWTAEEYVAYLHRYAQANGLQDLVHYQSRVEAAVLVDEKWHVTVSKEGQSHTARFDHLVVCTGSNSAPVVPEFKGRHQFTGTIVHSSAITDPSELKGRRVVYVGLGETASDLVYLASKVARKSTVSIRRRPGYLIPRYHDGMPTDLDTSRIYHCLPKHLDSGPLSFALRLKRRFEKGSLRSSEDRAIQDCADHFNALAGTDNLGPFRHASTKSCGFIRAHLAHEVDIKPEIVELKGDEVHFSDGTATVADIIVCCTGYTQRLDFLPREVTRKIPSTNALYDYMFLPGFGPRLAFIGFVRPGVGTTPAAAELQSRYLSRVLKGALALPDRNAMAHAIQRQQAMARTTFPLDFQRIGHIVDYYPYLSSIADKIGALPRQYRLFLLDIRLWYKVNFAFLCPGIFRLHGPGAKPDLVTPVLRALPTMSRKVLVLEGLLYVVCRALSCVGLRRFRPSR